MVVVLYNGIENQECGRRGRLKRTVKGEVRQGLVRGRGRGRGRGREDRDEGQAKQDKMLSAGRLIGR